MKSPSELDTLADVRKRCVKQLKEMLESSLPVRDKFDMTWSHWLVFVPFFWVLGLFSPERSRAFWEHYITVTVFFGTVIYVPNKWLRKLFDEWHDDDDVSMMPDWWYTILVHEKCHISQRADDGALKFIYGYLLTREGRFRYELEAYLTDFFIHGVLGHASLNQIGSLADKISKVNYMMKPSHFHQDEWETACYDLITRINDFIAGDKNLHTQMAQHGESLENIVAPELVLLYTNIGQATAHCRLPTRLRWYISQQVALLYKE